MVGGAASLGRSESQKRDNDGGGDNDDPDNWVDGHLVITVTDTGAGISKENQKLLFREGQQFDPHKLQGGGGSGFGLYISKSIVVLHGGRIHAHSAGEGQGTSFTFTVPMRRTKADMELATLQRARAVVAVVPSLIGEMDRAGSTPYRRHSGKSAQSAPMHGSTRPPADPQPHPHHPHHDISPRSMKVLSRASSVRRVAAEKLARGRQQLSSNEMGDLLCLLDDPPRLRDHPSMARVGGTCPQGRSRDCSSPSRHGAVASSFGDLLKQASPSAGEDAAAAPAPSAVDTAATPHAVHTLSPPTGGGADASSSSTAALVAEIARLRAALAVAEAARWAPSEGYTVGVGEEQTVTRAAEKAVVFKPAVAAAAALSLDVPMAGGGPGPGPSSAPSPPPRGTGRADVAQCDGSASVKSAAENSSGGTRRASASPRRTSTDGSKRRLSADTGPKAGDKQVYHCLVVDDSAMSRKMMIKVGSSSSTEYTA